MFPTLARVAQSTSIVRGEDSDRESSSPVYSANRTARVEFSVACPFLSFVITITGCLRDVIAGGLAVELVGSRIRPMARELGIAQNMVRRYRRHPVVAGQHVRSPRRLTDDVVREAHALYTARTMFSADPAVYRRYRRPACGTLTRV